MPSTSSWRLTKNVIVNANKTMLNLIYEFSFSAKYCNNYFKLSEVSGAFTTERISDVTRCIYMLESAIGDRIQLNVCT